MHRGWYPLIDRQVYRRMGPTPRDRGPDGRLPDTRHPSEKAVDYLSQTYPAADRGMVVVVGDQAFAALDGNWAITGYEVGKGPVYGRMVIAPVPNAPDEFTTETTFTYARPASR